MKNGTAVPGGLTRRVGHSSTEPRVGSSNLSGRASLSGNRKQESKNAALSGRLIPDAAPDLRAFVDRARQVGLSELSARVLYRRIGQVTAAVAAGSVDPVDGLEAVRILGQRARERDAALAVAS